MTTVNNMYTQMYKSSLKNEYYSMCTVQQLLRGEYSSVPRRQRLFTPLNACYTCVFIFSKVRGEASCALPVDLNAPQWCWFEVTCRVQLLVVVVVAIHQYIACTEREHSVYISRHCDRVLINGFAANLEQTCLKSVVAHKAAYYIHIILSNTVSVISLSK